ncbi:hypothetical protein O3M35_005004 [Rhynocoris fuscipes]|uniref:Gustatory receptor n=1 Tax=Rhynocoris fuscipes TaxID=488301 RepID=A0AAW1DMK9_9HEMI
MRPIFLISKCFGTYNYSHSIIYKNLLILYTILIILLVTWSSVYSFIFIDVADAEWYSNLVFFYIEKSHIFFLYISFITTICFHLFKQKNLSKELIFIDNIDKYLKERNFHFIYYILNHVWVGFFLILSIFVLLIIDYLYYTNTHTYYATLQLFSTYVPFLVLNSSIAQWYSIIKLIGDHFIFITRSALSTTDHRRLSELIRVHARLCTITRRINNLFGPNLFVIITYFYIMITEYIFLTMKTLIVFGKHRNNYNYSVVLAIFVIGSFLTLYAIVNSCNRTSSEVSLNYNL